MKHSIAFSRGSRCQFCPRQVDTISRQSTAQQRELLFVSMIWGDPRKCARVMAERVQNLCGVGASRHAIRPTCGWWVPGVQAPVPLTIFRSNSKFDQNLQCSSLKCTLPTTTKFCTRHHSVTVVTCAQFCCDLLSIFETRALPILFEFGIRSKYR